MAEVVAVSASPTHTFSKPRRPAIRLLAGLGVEGDAHLGETVTTRGVDLVALPTGTRLHLGGDAVVEVTGLRNPCFQIDDFQHGVLKEVLGRDENGGRARVVRQRDGNVVRKSGIMGIVLAGGEVRPGDPIRVSLPDGPHSPLVPV